jgi:hypothetical protein
MVGLQLPQEGKVMDCAAEISRVFLAGFDFGFAMFFIGGVSGLAFGVLLGKIHSWSKQR